MLKRTLFLSASLVFACPASADPSSSKQSQPYATVGDWHVVNVGFAPFCAGIWSVKGMSTSVVYNAKSGNVVLYLQNASATSVADGQKLKLDIIFTKGSANRRDNGWGEREFTAHVGNDGTRSFTSEPLTTEMLDDFAKQDYILVDYDHKMVAGAKLEKSAEMIAKLRECSIKAAGLNSDDPFLPR